MPGFEPGSSRYKADSIPICRSKEIRGGSFSIRHRGLYIVCLTINNWNSIKQHLAAILKLFLTSLAKLCFHNQTATIITELEKAVLTFRQIGTCKNVTIFFPKNGTVILTKKETVRNAFPIVNSGKTTFTFSKKNFFW